jgi:hypothetical protein
MEWTEDDYQRIKEIKSVSPEFIKEAIGWWNTQASESVKRFVVVTCYYEWLAIQANHADDILSHWEDELNEEDV